MTEDLERELARDLGSLGDRLADEKFTTELYRGLANRTWRKADGPDGHIVLSWRRADEVVNGLRERAGHERLALAQTGGEGEVSATVDGELRALGWTHAPLNLGRHDERHVEDPASPPPDDDPAKRRDDSVAHAEAERNRSRTL
jgi:hypothetical protein